MEDTPKSSILQNFGYDQDCINYCLSLKNIYSQQRQSLTKIWDDCLKIFNNSDDIDRVYEGRSKIQVPISDWKVRGLVARINKIIFNVQPIGRIESKKLDKSQKRYIDLWNKYIFEHQLDEIGFESAYRMFNLMQAIQGTAIAKCPYRLETKDFTFFDDSPPEEIVVKDDTFFENILIDEFYSDINKQDINESLMCIHSTSVPMEELRKNAEKWEIYDEIDPDTLQVVGEKRKRIGFYKNLALIDPTDAQETIEQQEYMELLGNNRMGVTAFKDSLKETKKTGFVHIDECWGLYDIDNDGYQEECLITIANHRVIIRMEPTPFKHKRYVRPFIVGQYIKIPNYLYGFSPIMKGINLIQEFNAARAQATDARTRSVANMWVRDASAMIKWDNIWRPNGIILSDNPNAIQPLVQPNLQNVSIQDAETISRDIDQLFGLAPVQQGTSDRRLIPDTARQTIAVIQQNDLPLNDIIRQKVEGELKPFLEMLYERNLQFKTVSDLMIVWEEKDIQGDEILQKAQEQETGRLKELVFYPDIKILGNLELDNEVAHQAGLEKFLNFSLQNPTLAQSINIKAVAQELLKAYGITDISDNFFYSAETMQQVQEQSAQAKQQGMMQLQRQQDMKQQQEIQKYSTEKGVDTAAHITKMRAEAAIESQTGAKVQ